MYTIGKFAKKIGKTSQTLRDWDKKGILKPAYKTKGGHRVYSEQQYIEILNRQRKLDKINVGYARVSSKKQKKDLERQIQLLEIYMTRQGIPYQIISDIGSGINYGKKGLKELLSLICSGQVAKVCVVYKDRLVRFGYELLEECCRLHNSEIEIINQSNEVSAEQELVDDILNIIHVFSCKINGKRGYLNKKIADKLSRSKD